MPMLTVATSSAVPVGVFVGCLIVGTLAAGRALPDLPDTRFAGLIFFAVCGMIGAALALIGLHIFQMVEAGNFDGAAIEISGEIVEMLWQTGVVLGVAMLLYLAVRHAELPADRRADAAEHPVEGR